MDRIDKHRLGGPQVDLEPVEDFERLPFGFFRPLLGGAVSGFFLHDVSEEPDAIIRHLYRAPSPREFDDILAFLQKEFNFVSLDEVVSHYREGKRLPRRAAFFSVDDGFMSCREIIAPRLKQAGIPATFFLTTGVLNNLAMFAGHKRSLLIEALSRKIASEERSPLAYLPPEGGPVEERRPEELLQALRRFPIHTAGGKASLDHLGSVLGVDWAAHLERHKPFMSDEDIRWLLQQGFDIGAHGVDHTKFQFLSDEARTAQVKECVETLCGRYGVQRVAFSFPNSASKVSREWMRRQLEQEPRLSVFVNTGRYAPNDRVMVNRLTLDVPLARRGAQISPGPGAVARSIQSGMVRRLVTQ